MESQEHSYQGKLTLSQAQDIIYDFLLELVKSCPPDQVLQEFKHLFIQHDESLSAETIPALHYILFVNDEAEFRNTLKRSCYILVNNWEVSRQYEAIQSLVTLFQNPLIYRPTVSHTLKRLRQWLIQFIEGDDFQDLKIFAARYTGEKTINRPGEWANRYAPYLLVPQYVNQKNPIEQRRAARALSRRLKDQFKFDLAMYTAYSQATHFNRRNIQNPTALGDGALRLIKSIVAKRGDFSYRNLARLFLEQVKGSTYKYFKSNLPFYLLYTVKAHPVAEQIQAYLVNGLTPLYSDHDAQMLDSSLLLRTCNRLIDSFMTEDRETPSYLFTLVLSRGNALTLAIILLKLILISRSSNLYLEVRIADLIRYYEQFPNDQCRWIIHFLEVFRVIFAIYAENIEYNLVRVKHASPLSLPQTSKFYLPEDDFLGDASEGCADAELETFRIFSQMLYYPVRDNTLDLPPEL
jgi:hypothetical protein